MQNIFIVPAMQHDCRAKPLYKITETIKTDTFHDWLLLAANSQAVCYAKDWEWVYIIKWVLQPLPSPPPPSKKKSQ